MKDLHCLNGAASIIEAGKQDFEAGSRLIRWLLDEVEDGQWPTALRELRQSATAARWDALWRGVTMVGVSGRTPYISTKQLITRQYVGKLMQSPDIVCVAQALAELEEATPPAPETDLNREPTHGLVSRYHAATRKTPAMFPEREEWAYAQSTHKYIGLIEQRVMRRSEDGATPIGELLDKMDPHEEAPTEDERIAHTRSQAMAKQPRKPHKWAHLTAPPVI